MNVLNFRFLRFVLVSLLVSGCGAVESLGTLSGWKDETPIPISRKVLETGDLPQTKESGYLAMAIPYAPVETVYQQLKRQLGDLKNRGEAHITVVTPVEAGKLKGKVSVAEMENIAASLHIQQSSIELRCVGKGTKGRDATYYLVVESQALVNIRKEIAKLFQQRGGAAAAFAADKFYPHITVGFTKRDLHEADGVIKDVKSCVRPINLQ